MESRSLALRISVTTRASICTESRCVISGRIAWWCSMSWREADGLASGAPQPQP
ncbi:unnamed protein product, partial [Ectocarpus sp. 12 AP-2014]